MFKVVQHQFAYTINNKKHYQNLYDSIRPERVSTASSFGFFKNSQQRSRYESKMLEYRSDEESI